MNRAILGQRLRHGTRANDIFGKGPNTGRERERERVREREG